GALVGASFLHPQVGSSLGPSTHPAVGFVSSKCTPSPALMLRSIAASRAQALNSLAALRCVSKDEDERRPVLRDANRPPSWPGLARRKTRVNALVSRPSTFSPPHQRKTWMPGTTDKFTQSAQA